MLTPEEQRTALAVARNTLAYYVRYGRRLPLEGLAETPGLARRRAVFVTLRAAGRLRGCIGSTVHEAPLLRAVRDTTVRAGFRDSRFERVAAHEIDDVTIEISALGNGAGPERPFVPVRDVSEIEIGRDGLYLEHGERHAGLLLPQVATERCWDTMEFLRAVCRKAGAPEGAWREPAARLYRFSAFVFSE